MQKMHEHCSGLDVHKESVVACVLHDDGGSLVETFGTTSREIPRLGEWPASEGVTIAAMESTGVYWKPIWNLLEGRFQLMLVNAQHIRRVPGRKTDVTDSQWIAELQQHGLMTSSLVPHRPRDSAWTAGGRQHLVERLHAVTTAWKDTLAAAVPP